jgi:hypothetical protein
MPTVRGNGAVRRVWGSDENEKARMTANYKVRNLFFRRKISKKVKEVNYYNDNDPFCCQWTRNLIDALFVRAFMETMK